VADLLLITDIPHIRQVFLRLADDRDLPLRVASSLEKGAEEIVADKPAMVFVQTHLSGLSADILLMHLKKLLGRRRTRFVLLGARDQVSDSGIKLYHSYIDTSLDDQALLDEINAAVATLSPKRKKTGAAPLKKADVTTATNRNEIAELLHEEPAGNVTEDISEVSLTEAAAQVAEAEAEARERVSEPSMEEQGVVYAPRPRMSVYSGFSGAFDNAVNNISETEVPNASLPEQEDAWKSVRTEPVAAVPLRSHSKRNAFLLWAVPLVAVVIGITLWQHRGSTPKSVNLSPASPNQTVAKPAPSLSATSQSAKASPSSAPATQAGAAKPQTAPVGPPGDKAAQISVAGSQSSKQQNVPASVVPRPTALPGFIPRTGLDKEYGVANPGWERYKGVVTEFKVYREGAAIKAIQVIDRGGQGIPDVFMKSALEQLAKTSSIAQVSQEKKEGYEIQRGQVAGNLSVVFYRDVKGGKLRAFAVTWQ